MNKIKEALAELRSYLNRDAEGVRRLDDISRIANDMRKELADRAEMATRADAATRMARDKEREAASSLLATKVELEHQSQVLQQTEHDLARASREVERLQCELRSLTPPDLPELPMSLAQPDAESPLLIDPRQLSDLVNSVRRDMRVAPTPLYSENVGGRMLCYELTDLIRSYGTDQLLRLGKFVAALALCNFPGAVVASENYFTCKRPGIMRRRKAEVDSESGVLSNFAYWFRSNVSDPDRAGFTLKNTANSGRDRNGCWVDGGVSP